MGFVSQANPGEFIEAIFFPCCGLVLLALVIILYAFLTSHRPESPRHPGSAISSDNSKRATRKPKRIWSRSLRPVAAILVAICLAGVVAWFGWDFRTRKTTIQLIDAKTGVPIRTAPSLVYAGNNGPGFESSVSYPVPGTIIVSWNHPCVIAIQIPGYFDIAPNGEANVDDSTPSVIRMRIDPK